MGIMQSRHEEAKDRMKRLGRIQIAQRYTSLDADQRQMMIKAQDRSIADIELRVKGFRKLDWVTRMKREFAGDT